MMEHLTKNVNFHQEELAIINQLTREEVNLGNYDLITFSPAFATRMKDKSLKAISRNGIAKSNKE